MTPPAEHITADTQHLAQETDENLLNPTSRTQWSLIH